MEERPSLSRADEPHASQHDAEDLARTPGPHRNHDETGDAEFSLEELSQSYARVMSGREENPESTAELDIFSEGDEDSAEEGSPAQADSADAQAVTPLSVLEALLFVGRPDNSAVSAKEIAAVMRGVTEEEILLWTAQLNEEYESTGGAMRIAEAADGFRMVLADELEVVRAQFYGRVREITLNQAAIDCLALIAYQPGVSRQQIEKQRSEPSGPILNQLVRRQLIEMRREIPQQSEAVVDEKEKPTACYYPTDKLVDLAGLGSLEDLPQVEELDIS